MASDEKMDTVICRQLFSKVSAQRLWKGMFIVTLNSNQLSPIIKGRIVYLYFEIMTPLKIMLIKNM